MIMNNYVAMNYIKNDLVKKDLEIGDLLYLQSVLTKDTIDVEDEVGRFRTDSDPIYVEFQWKVAHIPPTESFLTKELNSFIDFANNTSQKTFIHPVIKAIIIHFWIGYLHPFCDGNGRTARALFYWYLLKNGYFWFSYMPLSSVIKNSKVDYGKSYIYTEQDDYDLTYFINYNLRKIQQAFNKYQEHLKNSFNKNHTNLRALNHLSLNDRQKKLLLYFQENLDSYTNPTTHMNYYGIAKVTAINDLKKLEKDGFLESRKTEEQKNTIQ